MNIRTVVVILFVLIQIQIGVGVYYYQSEKQDLVVVDAEALFEGFTYKQELEGKLKAVDQEHKTTMDSLTHRLQRLEEQAEQASQSELKTLSEDYKQQMHALQERKGRYERSMSNAIKTYDEQIWQQLRSYVNEYAEANDIAILYGYDQTNKGILAHQPGVDKTAEVLTYINSRYAGH